jgi:2-aminoethylphosphonate-pyruvate transaminase
MTSREWILLNPGPANTSKTVREALLCPDLCHREPEFFEVMRECRERLVQVAGIADTFTAVLFTGSGTAAVEAAMSSVIPRDRAALVVVNGVYGERMMKICRAHEIAAVPVASDITVPASPAAVRDALRAHPEVSHVVVVHHETTTGLLNPVGEIAAVAYAEGRRVIVDAMSSLFGEPLEITQPGIDYVMASANKCLGGVPGISFVLARTAALAGLKDAPARTVYLDLYTHWATQEQDNTPFTPAVQVLHAMRQALVELAAEGVAARIARYAENARVLREGMAALGFDILVPPEGRCTILTTFKLLPGLAYDPLHDAMKRRGFVIYAGQGNIRTYAFRVSNMGTLTPGDMKDVVAGFAASLAELGVKTPAAR